MKKLNVVVLLLLITASLANGQFTKVGGGLGFTTGYDFHKMKYDYNKSGNLLFFAKGIYEISLPFHISPSISYFFPHLWKDTQLTSEDHKVLVTTMMVDLNAHYVFNSLDRFEFYGLAGGNVLLAWKKDTYKMLNGPTSKIKEKDNALGLNLGLGSYIKLTEQIDLSVEAKYLLSKYSQFMLNAGVLVNIQWLSKNENQGM